MSDRGKVSIPTYVGVRGYNLIGVEFDNEEPYLLDVKNARELHSWLGHVLHSYDVALGADDETTISKG